MGTGMAITVTWVYTNRTPERSFPQKVFFGRISHAIPLLFEYVYKRAASLVDYYTINP